MSAAPPVVSCTAPGVPLATTVRLAPGVSAVTTAPAAFVYTAYVDCAAHMETVRAVGVVPMRKRRQRQRWGCGGCGGGAGLGVWGEAMRVAAMAAAG